MPVDALCLRTNLIHRKKYAISWWVCKNMPNFTEHSLTEFQKFMEILQSLSIPISSCYITID